MGRNKTIYMIKSRYYWPNQYRDVDNWVSKVVLVIVLCIFNIFFLLKLQIKQCDRCQRILPALRTAPPELHPIPVKSEVWNLVGMDLMGPYHKTKAGNQYILTMTCYFSKWVEAFAIADKSATSVAAAVYQAYCRHGAPVSIITDQGREFINEVYNHY